MKKLILASAAILTMSAGAAFATMTAGGLVDASAATTDGGLLQLAKNGSDDAAGDDRGGNRGGTSRDDTGSTSGQGRGRGRGRGGDDTVRNDNSTGGTAVSGSGRRKPRVPGGSGCDSAGDIAEHASCTPSQ